MKQGVHEHDVCPSMANNLMKFKFIINFLFRQNDCLAKHRRYRAEEDQRRQGHDGAIQSGRTSSIVQTGGDLTQPT
jgi:hypothetical protein